MKRITIGKIVVVVVFISLPIFRCNYSATTIDDPDLLSGPPSGEFNQPFPSGEIKENFVVGDKTGADDETVKGYSEFFFDIACPGVAEPDKQVVCDMTIYPPGQYQVILPNAPEGMAFDAENHRLLWTPSRSQPGTYSIVVELFRGAFEKRSKTISIFVPESNDVPEKKGGCSTYALEDDRYTCLIGIFSETLGSDIVFELIEPPDGMTIDRQSGLVSFIPGENLADKEFSIKVLGRKGSQTEEYSYTLKVIGINDPPEVTYDCDAHISGASETFSCIPTIRDEEGAEKIEFGLADDAPTGIKIDRESGKIVWNPGENDYGDHSLRIYIKDGDLVLPSTMNLKVDNQAPRLLIGTCIDRVEVGKKFECDFQVEDIDDDDQVMVKVKEKPDSMLFSQRRNELTWIPEIGDVGEHEIEISADDGELEDRIQMEITVVMPPPPVEDQVEDQSDDDQQIDETDDPGSGNSPTDDASD